MSSIQHVPLELMQTFVKIVEYEGDATAAAQELGISQPSISRRLAALREIVGDSEDRPWLILKGKRWLLTPAGERVRGVIADLVRRYEQVELFIAESQSAKPMVSIACGQTAASGFVRLAIEQLAEKNSDIRIRLATPRGKSRIEGVAGGQFDLAIVTDDEATIRDVAGIDLHIEPLHADRFVVVANPTRKSPWAKAWEALPVRRPLTANDLGDLPMILPELDASRRQFDSWFKRTTDKTPNVVLEVGGWHNLLRFAQSGMGIGFATESAVHSMEPSKPGRQGAKPSLAMRMLDEADFPPDQIRLIARKQQGHDTPDLSASAYDLYDILRVEGVRYKV
ncbi:MAG: LysR substrate-binding domain-containing protein [Pirellula sp.]|jgi:DNA-binding transcriptional LysR family regulator